MKSAGDATKWQAFSCVKRDDALELEKILSRADAEEWRHWRNFAGSTLHQVAETESKRRGVELQCLQLLSQLLQRLGLHAVQVPRVTYHNTFFQDLGDTRVHEVAVPIDEVKHHKTLKYVPDINIVEGKEVMEVPQITVREELKVIDHHVEEVKEIRQVHIREVEDVVRVPKTETTTVEEELPVRLAPVHNVVERPVVDVVERLARVPVVKDMVEQEESIGIPLFVEVPKTMVQQVPVRKSRAKDVVVSNITERPVFVDKVEEVVKIVEVPETTVIQKVRYVPKFCPNPAPLVERGVYEADYHQRWDSQHVAMQEDGQCVSLGSRAAGHAARLAAFELREVEHLREDLQALRRVNEDLQKERARMQADLQSCGHTLESLRAEIDMERRECDAAMGGKTRALSSAEAPQALRTPSTAAGEGSALDASRLRSPEPWTSAAGRAGADRDVAAARSSEFAAGLRSIDRSDAGRSSWPSSRLGRT